MISRGSSLGVSIGSGTPKTQSFASGSLTNGYLSVYVASSAVPTGVTFNGVAMTKLAESTISIAEFDSLWGLPIGNGGTHDIVVTWGSSSFCILVASSYEGVDQSSPYDGSGQVSETSSGTSVAINKTTSNDNEWIVGHVRSGAGGYSLTGGTRFNTTLGDNVASYDSGNLTPAGAKTVTYATGGGSDFLIITGQAIKEFLAPSTPVVDTSAVTDITENSATGNGEITDVGSGDATERGFVYSTSSHADPGNVAPASSDYEDVEAESGTFSADVFDLPLTSLSASTEYFVRAFAQNGDGYAYGPEVSFTTEDVAPFRFENLPGVTYNPDDTVTIYAERLNDILDRLDALES